MEKGKKDNATKPEKVKTDWVKDAFLNWALAAEKNDRDPLRLKDAPEWASNAYAECAKVILPSGLPWPRRCVGPSKDIVARCRYRARWLPYGCGSVVVRLPHRKKLAKRRNLAYFFFDFDC